MLSPVVCALWRFGFPHQHFFHWHGHSPGSWPQQNSVCWFRNQSLRSEFTYWMRMPSRCRASPSPFRSMIYSLISTLASVCIHRVSKGGLDCIRHCKLNPSLQGLLLCHGKDSQTHSVLYKPTFSSPGAPPPFTTCEFPSFILTWQCFLLHLKVWLDFWDLLSINAQAW